MKLCNQILVLIFFSVLTAGAQARVTNESTYAKNGAQACSKLREKAEQTINSHCQYHGGVKSAVGGDCNSTKMQDGDYMATYKVTYSCNND